MECNLQPLVVQMFLQSSKGFTFYSNSQQGVRIFYPKGHVMTSTSGHAPELNVNSNISVQNATNRGTLSANAMVPADITQLVLHPQLQEQMFKPVTPIKYQVLDKLL